MSGKPQETQTDEQDLLEQIITQGLEKINAPAPAAAAGEAPADETPPAPGQEDSGGAMRPAKKNNRRSTVYLYLLILFGAAFLMLLLAYFVQRRSNESAISYLQDSMNLSREQLLDEIRELEAQNGELGEELDRLTGELSDLQERYGKKTHEADDLFDQYTLALARLSGWENFWALEQSYQAEDYEACVALILLADMSEYGCLPPSQEISERREEIIQALVDRGFLPEDRHDISDYEDLINAYLQEHTVWE